jgi:cation:H+ antiporter
MLLAGLVLLLSGAELLVRGASRLALGWGISPLVVGLTIVALGTSSPELAVSVRASLAGQTDIAIGNVVGSNIFNVLCILGISALMIPLAVSQQLIRIDVPLMILVSLGLLLMGLDHSLGLADGIILFTASLGYIIFSVIYSKKEKKKIRTEYKQEFGTSGNAFQNRRRWPLHVVFIVTGLVALIFGARWLVDAAVTIARLLDIPEMIIGLTIVAAGTSLPELATSVIASIRGERDIAVGNVVGSNILNILLILGLSAIIARNGLTVAPATLRFDLPVMIATAFACFPVFFTGKKISRWEGGVFLFYYAAYIIYLILQARTYSELEKFSWVMGSFVLPLTGMTMVVLTVRETHISKRKIKEQKAKTKNQI